MRTVLCVLEMLDDATPNACGYLRLLLPLTKKIVSEQFDIRFVRLAELEHFKADAVITHRLALDTLTKALQVVSYCRRTGARLIFDLDDDLLSLPTHHPEFEKLERLKHIALRLVTEANELWVSTEVLAERYLRIARNVTVIPNELDDRIWGIRADIIPNKDRPVRFLYMGTSTHWPDFDRLVCPALFELKAEFGEKIELDLIGVTEQSVPGRQWRVLNRPSHCGKSYPSFVAWLQSLASYDVGLAPLLDFVFNNCKSDVKWLEYSAMGLATIAANLPPYNSSIAHERTGLLADSNPNSFRIAMRRLVVDSELRGSLQSQAFAVASEKLRLSPTVEPRLERLEQLTKRSRAIRNLPTNGIASSAPTDLCEYLDRRVLSHAFVHGRGIQIGALQKPLPVSPDAQVTYVDRTPKEILYERYQELRGSNLVNVDRIDDGETLSTFGSESQDFIIANHFFDHCQDLTQTIKNFLRVLHPGGLIYMSIPDMRHTFDRERPRTPLGHVVVDHARGAEINREQHFHERLAEPHFGRSYAGESIEARFRELIAQENSVDFRTDHFHALIKRCAEVEALPVSVMFVGELDEEIIFIIRKLDSSGSKTSCSV